MEVPYNQDWVLAEGERTINGYKCQRAITSYGGRDYEAWYTPSLPVADGPYVFAGLPGLIVQIYDTKNYYTFTLQSFRAESANRFWEKDFVNPRSQAIGRSDYVDHMLNVYSNPQPIPGVLDMTAEDLIKIKQRNAWRLFWFIEQKIE